MNGERKIFAAVFAGAHHDFFLNALAQGKALSQARLEHAVECLSAAKNLLETKNYKSAANRSYYAVFHAMRAVLAFDEIDMKRHSGIIS